jgi:ParB-like chromosome segregation protein Spo0J
MRVPITSIRENPSNPRKLDRAKFEKLVQSIRDFPEMLDKRPIIVADGIILGGNMRHKAAIQAGMNDIPIIDASDWTEEQRQQFIIKDNVSFGEWDWDTLANEWDPVDLELWGLDVWQPKEQEESVKEVCNCCGK